MAPPAPACDQTPRPSLHRARAYVYARSAPLPSRGRYELDQELGETINELSEIYFRKHPRMVKGASWRGHR